MTTDARNPDLEARITADPFDRDAWVVFADWLQEQGDVRGELAALHHAGNTDGAAAYLAEHADYLLGPLAAHQRTHDDGGNNGASHLRTAEQETAWQATQREAFLWNHGFIERLRLSHDENLDDTGFKGRLADVLAQVLAHPSARYVTEMAFHANGEVSEDNTLENLIAVLGEHAPETVRKLTFGDNVDQISWYHVGDIGPIWGRMPHLRILEIESGSFDVGAMIAPALERAVFISGGLNSACADNLARAQMPAIQHLEIYYGDPNYGGNCTIADVEPLLGRTDLPKLRYLGLKNAQFANDLARAVVGSPVVAGLTTLDLSLGAMTDEGARALHEGRAQLAHLECLDLTRNFLTAEGIALVQGICKKVVTEGQEKPYQRGNGELRYFVSIAE